MQEWSNPERVAEYLSRQIPHRRTAEALLLQALPPRVDRFLDLGTGDGRLVSTVRSAHPDAEAIGLDSSEPMLARARERFAGGSRVEFRLHDLKHPLSEQSTFDAIVSGLAIHHLEDYRKRELFTEVRSLLSPGASSPTSTSSRRPPPSCTSASAARSGAPRTTPPTASPASAISSTGCAPPASPTPTVTSSGCS